MEKRFVKISYTARIKDGGIFDTTDETVAKEEGIFDEKRVYSAIPVIIGEKQVIEGLDDALAGMNSGEEKEVEIPPEKAYGQRNSNLIRLVPMKVFKQHKMTPVPGMPIELDGKIARIQTVAGGRVRVDFNPELAGKTLVYNVKIEDEAKTKEDKCRHLIERSFNTSDGFELKINKGDLDIVISEKLYRDRNILVRKASFVAEAFRFMDAGKITFSETWENKGKVTAKEETTEKVKEEAKEQAKEETAGKGKEEAKEQAKEETAGKGKEEAKEQAKEETTERVKEEAKEPVKEDTSEKPKEEV